MSRSARKCPNKLCIQFGLQFHVSRKLFYLLDCLLRYVLFVCDVPCIVCVYMCSEQLPPGGYPIAVKYIISYQNNTAICRAKLDFEDVECSPVHTVPHARRTEYLPSPFWQHLISRACCFFSPLSIIDNLPSILHVRPYCRAPASASLKPSWRGT